MSQDMQEQEGQPEIMDTHFESGDTVVLRDELIDGQGGWYPPELADGHFEVASTIPIENQERRKVARHHQHLTVVRKNGNPVVSRSFPGQPELFSGYFFKKRVTVS